MVVGSILLGKKAGLLAGLLGAGAKVILEQRKLAAQNEAPTTAEVPNLVPDPPAPALPSDSTKLPDLMPDSLAEAAALVSTSPTPEPSRFQDVVEESTAPNQTPESIAEPDESPIVEPEPPETPPVPAVPELNQALPLPFVSITPVEEESVSGMSVPAVEAGPVSDQVLTEPPEPSVLSAPPLPPASASEDAVLEQALSHSEAFRNFGPTSSVIASPAAFSAFAETFVTPAPLEQAPEPTVPCDAFVKWPEGDDGDDAESAQTTFQQFVASVFQEATQGDSAPAAESAAAPSFSSLTDFAPILLEEPTALVTPPLEVAPLEAVSLLQPLPPEATPAEPAAVVDPPAPAPAPLPDAIELTPEDIWRLAAAESLEPLPTGIAPTPAAPATAESPEALEFIDFANFTLSPEPPVAPVPASSPSMEPELVAPPGIDPFVELFGSASAVAPTDALAEGPSEQALINLLQRTPKRLPLLTPEEEDLLNQPSSQPTTSESPSPAISFTSADSGTQLSPSLHFAPKADSAARVAERKGKSWIMLLLLAAVAGGAYFNRELLVTQWNAWNRRVDPPAIPSRSKTTLPNEAPAPAPPPVIAVPPAPLPPDPQPPETAPTPTVPPIETLPATPVEPAALAPPPQAQPPALEPTALLTPVLPAPELIAPSDTLPLTMDANEQKQLQAEAAIKAFLSAANKEELLSMILNRDQVTPSLNKYYEQQPLAPTPFTEIVLDSSARISDTKVQAFLYRVRSAERPQGFPICAEQTAEGFKIEWTAFIQCRDRAAANFWKSSTSDAASLYVILKRSHYFGEDMTDLDDYDCFKVNSPNPDEEPVYSFARKDSSFSRKFRNQLTWDANYFAVAKFVPVKNAKGSVHHEIVDIERFNWRSSGK